MFGTKKRIGELETRLTERIDRLEAAGRSQAEALEAQLASRLDQVLEQAAASPEERTRLLLNSVADELRGALTGALEDLQAARSAAAEIYRLREQAASPPGPRQYPELNVVHQAKRTGYVALYFNGGYTDIVELLAGADNPPQDLVGALNTRNDLNSYVGTVVRQGEFWLARSQKNSSGVICVFTPFL